MASGIQGAWAQEEKFFHRRPKKRCDVCLCQSVSPTAQTDVTQRSSRGAPDNEAPQGAPQVKVSIMVEKVSITVSIMAQNISITVSITIVLVFGLKQIVVVKSCFIFMVRSGGGPYCPYGNP